MKNKRWLKPTQIAESVQEFELLEVIRNPGTGKILYFRAEDQKGRPIELAPSNTDIDLPEGNTTNNLTRGVRLTVRASKRRLALRDNMITFSKIFKIEPAVQIDTEDFL